jgi:sensor histidine kinase regulating citrate/malate metabolism
MRRIFWLALGLGAGATASVMAGRWMKRQTRKMAPANLARQAGGRAVELGAVIAQAAREFRAGAVEKEAEIRSSLEE